MQQKKGVRLNAQVISPVVSNNGEALLLDQQVDTNCRTTKIFPKDLLLTRLTPSCSLRHLPLFPSLSIRLRYPNAFLIITAPLRITKAFIYLYGGLEAPACPI